MSLNNKKTYALVEFLNGKKKECAVVPLIWLIDDRMKCYWSKTRSQEVFDSLVLENEPYDATWMKYKVHRVLKVSDDYSGIMKYMEIILEHGSTEDGLNFDISQKKHVESSDYQEEENLSDSSNFHKRMTKCKTKCKNKKNMQKSIDHGESELFHSSDSENEINKQKNLNADDSQEHELSFSEINANNLKNKNAFISTTLRREKIDGRCNSGIIPRSENAAKMQFKGNNSSDQCIKDAIQSWLKLAKSRHVYNANAKKN